MKIKINDVLDEFLYRYADEGGNFDDPFLKIVHDLLNVYPAKTLTDEEIDDLVHEYNCIDDYPHEFVRACIRKAQEK